jgi:hypothetical protein
MAAFVGPQDAGVRPGPYSVCTASGRTFTADLAYMCLGAPPYTLPAGIRINASSQHGSSSPTDARLAREQAGPTLTPTSTPNAVAGMPPGSGASNGCAEDEGGTVGAAGRDKGTMSLLAGPPNSGIPVHQTLQVVRGGPSCGVVVVAVRSVGEGVAAGQHQLAAAKEGLGGRRRGYLKPRGQSLRHEAR